jgi:hypothetical protein
MKLVNFYRKLKIGRILDGNAILVNNKVVFNNMSKMFVDEVMQNGITGANGKRLTVNDGQEFLENLKHHFNGVYFRASEVIEL